MSHAFIMLVALSGLGCQNKPVEPSDAPAALSPAPTIPAQAQETPAAIPAPPPASPSASTSGSPEAPSPTTSAAPAAALEGTTPPPYPRYFTEPYPDPEALYSTHAGILYATLYSFVWGKDPGIPGPGEIEASAFADGPPH
jgi:hypothetical protein